MKTLKSARNLFVSGCQVHAQLSDIYLMYHSVSHRIANAFYLLGGKNLRVCANMKTYEETEKKNLEKI